jgi:hypothetical protein
MLKDVLKLTKLFYNEFLVNGKVPISPICLYDSYRYLNELINNIHLVAKHYLALRLDEDFLQFSSLGEPKVKWRHILNEDLETLNESVRKHLLHLQMFAVGNLEEKTYLIEEKYHEKAYYGFVKSHYNVGYLNSQCTHISCHILTTTSYDPKNIYLSSTKMIDISTYEKREHLKAELIEKAQKLDTLKNNLMIYIKEHYTIENLFYQESRVVH